jgi:hypothetical protein
LPTSKEKGQTVAKSSIFNEKPVGQEAIDLARKHFPVGSNGKRGKASATLNALAHMYEIAALTKPITGRGVGYRLLNRGVIATMADMPSVYEQLVEAREKGLIPWWWIVDETRELEIGTSYASRRSAYETLLYNYAHPLWLSQPYDAEIWSEKGTVRGLIKEILDEYRLGFRVFHGYTSATSIYEIATEIDRPLVALYVGDHDPSGCDMRESDIPKRLEKYGAENDSKVDFRVIALTLDQVREHNLPSIQAKPKDPRYSEYKKKHGTACWELDALDPRTLRAILKREVEALIDWDAWNAAKDEERNAKRDFEGAVRNWAGIDPLMAEIKDALRWAED